MTFFGVFFFCCSLTFEVVGVSGAYPPHGPRDEDEVVDVHVVAEELGALTLRFLHTCNPEHQTNTLNFNCVCLRACVCVCVCASSIP